MFPLCHISLTHEEQAGPAWWRLSAPLPPVPEQVAAEDQAEHEDEEADAQDDDVDVYRQVEDGFRCHCAAPQVAQALWEDDRSEVSDLCCRGGRKQGGKL